MRQAAFHGLSSGAEAAPDSPAASDHRYRFRHTPAFHGGTALELVAPAGQFGFASDSLSHAATVDSERAGAGNGFRPKLQVLRSELRRASAPQSYHLPGLRE